MPCTRPAFLRQLRHLNLVPLLIVVCSAGLAAADLTDVPVSEPWKADREGDVAVIRLVGGTANAAPLNIPLTVAAATHYRLEWEMQGKANDASEGVAVMVKTGVAYEQTVALGTTWERYQICFFSAEAATAQAAIWLRGTTPRTLAIRRLRLVPLAAAELEANLLPNPDFEISGTLPVNWWPYAGAKANRGSIVASKDFLAGQRSLQVDAKVPAEEAVSLQLSCLPVVPGRTVEVSFWAKSDQPVEASVLLDAWVYPHQGTHFHQRTTVRLSNEWRPYSFTADIPADLAVYPDLTSRQINLRIDVKGGSQATAMFDQFSYLHKPSAAAKP